MRERWNIWLKKSEKIFKTDMVYLTKGGFWVTASQAVVSLSSFILAMAFAHFVSKNDYGEYKYILSIAGTLGALTLSGIGTAVLQSISRGYEGSLHQGFWMNIKWSIAFIVVAFILAIYYLASGNTNLGISMLIVGSLTPIWNSTNLYSALLAAKKDFRRNSLYYDIGGNLFPFLCLLTVMFFSHSSLVLVLTYFVSNCAIGIYYYNRTITLYRPNKNTDPSLTSYSKHLSLMNILVALANNIDQILLFHYLGAIDLAIYNFAIAIPNQIKGPLKGLDNLMFPKFVERTDTEIHVSMNHKILVLTLAIVILIIGYIALCPLIFSTFFPTYMNSVFYSQIFSLSLLGMVTWPTTTYLAAKKMVYEQYLNNISTSLVQIALIYIGIIYGGLMGVIMARVATRIFSGAANYYFYKISK